MDRTEVPLEAIVGSFERCADYTRNFLPLKDHDQHRWTRVERAFKQSRPLPPIQVTKVGQGYFVMDGHHRVSVARQLGLSHLEAEVFQADTQPQVEN
jgi:ParB-like chromosome segregation protein Spo0J